MVDGVVARTTYGEDFAAVVERDNVYGVQFHPEKSSSVGLQIFKNFCELGQSNDH
jgi:imidazole glycerol-phosphate synthase subunit HisH